MGNHATSGHHNQFADAFEAWLGPASQRYFGVGYRQSHQHLNDVIVHADAELTRVTGTASLTPWRRVGAARVDHVGTVDAIVIAANLAGVVLIAGGRAHPGVEPEFEAVKVKAGTAPVFDLSCIPVTAEREMGSPSDESVTVRCFVAGITVELEYAIGGAPLATTTGAASVDDLLGAPAGRYFGSGFRERELRATTAELALPLITANFTSEPPLTSFGVIECLTFSSQMAQIALYESVGVRREETQNLWMRRCEFRSTRSVGARPRMQAELAVTRLTRLEREARTVVSAQVEIASFPGWVGTAALAFSLAN